MAVWNKQNNYSPQQVNDGNQWTSQPSVTDLIKVTETVFNLNEQEKRESLVAHCAGNNASSHRDCSESGWMYVQAGDNDGPTPKDYMVFTMAYSESNLIQLAFSLSDNTVWICRAYPDTNANKLWTGWENFRPEITKQKTFLSSAKGINGSLQRIKIVKSGTYHIKAAGASGGLGAGARDYNVLPGKGAVLEADFQLNTNDELVILVGQKGLDVGNLELGKTDFTAGGGGGATFIFKTISAITDSRYQFLKDGEYLETLMVVAGGAGTGDASYNESYRSQGGMPGGASSSNCYTPSNYTAYSAKTWLPGSGDSYGGSIKHFIDNNGVGGTYNRNGAYSLGGYGGGGAADDLRPSGGGWTTKSNASTGVCSTSWCIGFNINGLDGENEGDGYCELNGVLETHEAILDIAGSGDKFLADDGQYKELLKYNNRNVRLELSYNTSTQTLEINTIEL